MFLLTNLSVKSNFSCSQISCHIIWLGGVRQADEFIMKIFLFLAIFLFFNASVIFAQKVNVRIITDQADAVLWILEKKESGQAITEEDWRKVFTSEGYVRLKKRELSFQRPFEEADFKTFVLSENLATRKRALAETLAKWKRADVNKIAKRPLSYLPKNAQIRAKIYPVIKPRENSFVFEIKEDPAIFLYLDPTKSKEIFQNEFAHELHHIGYSTACPNADSMERIGKFPQNMQRVFGWISAFGEGFAMLAAVGSADVHPHAESLAKDRERWDKDLKNFNNDLQTLEKFFLDVGDGKLSEAEERKTAFSFFGIQGPWYTVGWQMAVIIEKTFGRKKLIDCMCDRQMLLPTYNKAVKIYNRKHKKMLGKWSDDFLKRLK
jgi:hypothetical protein